VRGRYYLKSTTDILQKIFYYQREIPDTTIVEFLMQNSKTFGKKIGQYAYNQMVDSLKLKYSVVNPLINIQIITVNVNIRVQNVRTEIIEKVSINGIKELIQGLCEVTSYGFIMQMAVEVPQFMKSNEFVSLYILYSLFDLNIFTRESIEVHRIGMLTFWYTMTGQQVDFALADGGMRMPRQMTDLLVRMFNYIVGALPKIFNVGGLTTGLIVGGLCAEIFNLRYLPDNVQRLEQDLGYLFSWPSGIGITQILGYTNLVQALKIISYTKLQAAYVLNNLYIVHRQFCDSPFAMNRDIRFNYTFEANRDVLYLPASVGLNFFVMTVPMYIPVFTVNLMEDYIDVIKNIYQIQKFVVVLDEAITLNGFITVNYGFRNPELLLSTEKIYEIVIGMFKDVPMIVDIMEDTKRIYHFYSRLGWQRYVGLVDRRIRQKYDLIYQIILLEPMLFKFSFEFNRTRESLFQMGRLRFNNGVIGNQVSIGGYDYIIRSGRNDLILQERQIINNGDYLEVSLPVIIKVYEAEKTEIKINEEPYPKEEYRLDIKFKNKPHIYMTIVDTFKVLPTISYVNSQVDNFIVKGYLPVEKSAVTDVNYITRGCFRPRIHVNLVSRDNIEKIYYESVLLIQ